MAYVQYGRVNCGVNMVKNLTGIEFEKKKLPDEVGFWHFTLWLKGSNTDVSRSVKLDLDGQQISTLKGC